MAFFEEERRLGGETAAGPPTTMWEIADAAVKSQWYVDNVAAKNVAAEEAFNRRIDDVFKVTGQRLDNPLLERAAQSELLADRPVRFAPPQMRRATAETADSFEVRERRFLSELDKLGEQFPEALHLIKPGVSPMDDARARARKSEHDMQDALARYRGPMGTGTLAQFAGGFYGTLSDPWNASTMMLGPTGKAGAGLLGLAWMGVKQGAANAAVEAASQPWVAAWRQEAGVGYDSKTFFGNVGGAFAFGFGIDTAVRGAVRGVQRARGLDPVLDAEGGIDGWKRPGEADPASIYGLDIVRDAGGDEKRQLTFKVTKGGVEMPLEIRGEIDAGTMTMNFVGDAGEAASPAVVRRLAALINDRFPQVERFAGVIGDNVETGRLVARAMDDDVAALREMARRTGVDQDPRTKVLLDQLDDADATKTRAPGLDPHESDFAEAQAVRHLSDPREPPPGPVEPRPLILYRGEGPNDPLRRQNRRGEWYTTDLERAIGYMGEAEGRRGLFRIEVPPGRIAELRRGIDASEFMVPLDLHGTRGEVSADTIAARHALASGELDTLGMAQIIRDEPAALDASVPLSTEPIRQAAAISRLSDPAFEMVMRGEADPERAALVSRLVPDETRQASVLSDLERMAPASPAEARQAIGVLAREGEPRQMWEGMDDPHGAEGDRQIVQLERMLGVVPEGEKLKAADGGAGAPVDGASLDIPEAWRSTTWSEIARRIESGEEVVFPPEHLMAQRRVLEADGLNRVPKDTDVGFLVGVRPGGFSADKGQLIEPVFQLLDGRRASLISMYGPEITLGEFRRGRAFYTDGSHLFPEVGSSQPTILHIALPSEPIFPHAFVGLLDHEITHAIIASGALGGDRLRRIWKHSRALGVVDMTVDDMFKAIGLPKRNVNPNGSPTIAENYWHLYRDRPEPERLRAINEEGVTHFVQLYRAGYWAPEQIAPVKDILDDFDAGRLGGRGAAAPERLEGPLAMAEAQPSLFRSPFEKAALDDTPEIRLERTLGEADELKRMAEVIRECKA